jgi:quercetin dioxygenase-like cupin family protein
VGLPSAGHRDIVPVYFSNSPSAFSRRPKMKVIDHASLPHGGADEHHFRLPALMQPLLGRDDGLPVRLYRVTFGEGARTNWHKHDDVQVLYGLSGTCVVVDREGNELRLHAGDVVVIDPDEEHWHGAAPGSAGEHLAINAGDDTTWLDSSA